MLDYLLEIYHANDFKCMNLNRHEMYSNFEYINDVCAFLQFIFVTTILFNTEITYNGVEYPRWLIAVGWASCLVSIICIPTYFVYKLSKMNGSFKKVPHLYKYLNWKATISVITLFVTAHSNCNYAQQLGPGWWFWSKGMGNDDP